ncbi:glycosyltransferase family 1 protein, partial [Enterococcus faecium]|nr:glycosyltransferase family 1 protein [Enterococcus faecium]
SNVKKWNFLNDGNSYEKTSIKKIVISKVGRSKLLDWFGYIQVLKNKDNIEADILGSYNRFIETEKPYVIYLENPTALFHYKLERENSYLGKKKIEKYINDPNL